MADSPPLIVAIDGPSASGKGTVARKLAARLGFAHLDTGLLYRAAGFAVISAGGDPGDAELAEAAALALAFGLSGGEDASISLEAKGPPQNRRPPPPVRAANAPLERLQPSTPRPQGAGESSVDTAVPMIEAKLELIDFKKLMNDDVLRSDEASVAASKVAAVPSVRAALLKFQKDFCSNPPGGAKGAVLDGRDIGTVIAPDARVKIFVTASAEARAQRRFRELQGRGLAADYDAVLADMKERDARDSERAIAPTRPAPDAVMLDTTELTAEQAFEKAVKIVESRG